MIREHALLPIAAQMVDAKPFPHFVCDDFLDPEIAQRVSEEFPCYDDPCWHRYSSVLEEKRACDNWRAFGPATYRLLAFLISPSFIQKLGILTGVRPLYADPGLHGGGLHISPSGGRLNPHLDYARHPQTGYARKLNLIVYLNSAWEDSWGGGLGLWEGDETAPQYMKKQIMPRFNRAVLMDVSGGAAWHGLPYPINCPEGQYRKSLAIYYLTEAHETVSQRTRAQFAPTEDQVGDARVMDLIERRASPRYG